jgi:hypothetical protein
MRRRAPEAGVPPRTLTRILCMRLEYADTLHIARRRWPAVHPREKDHVSSPAAWPSVPAQSPQAALHKIFEPRDEVLDVRSFRRRAARRVG